MFSVLLLTSKGDTVDLRGMHAPDRDEPLARVAAVEAAVAMATGAARESEAAKVAALGVVQAAALAEILWESCR
jgi:hypothetical protein